MPVFGVWLVFPVKPLPIAFCNARSTFSSDDVLLMTGSNCIFQYVCKCFKSFRRASIVCFCNFSLFLFCAAPLDPLGWLLLFCAAPLDPLGWLLFCGDLGRRGDGFDALLRNCCCFLIDHCLYPFGCLFLFIKRTIFAKCFLAKASRNFMGIFGVRGLLCPTKPFALAFRSACITLFSDELLLILGSKLYLFCNSIKSFRMAFRVLAFIGTGLPDPLAAWFLLLLLLVVVLALAFIGLALPVGLSVWLAFKYFLNFNSSLGFGLATLAHRFSKSLSMLTIMLFILALVMLVVLIVFVGLCCS